MNNGINPQNFNKMFDKKTAQILKKAVSQGNTDQLLSSLSDKDKENFNHLLKDKAARDKLLSSPEVKELLKGLLGD